MGKIDLLVCPESLADLFFYKQRATTSIGFVVHRPAQYCALLHFYAAINAPNNVSLPFLTPPRRFARFAIVPLEKAAPAKVWLPFYEQESTSIGFVVQCPRVVLHASSLFVWGSTTASPTRLRMSHYRSRSNWPTNRPNSPRPGPAGIAKRTG